MGVTKDEQNLVLRYLDLNVFVNITDHSRKFVHTLPGDNNVKIDSIVNIVQGHFPLRKPVAIGSNGSQQAIVQGNVDTGKDCRMTSFKTSFGKVMVLSVSTSGK